MKCLNPNCGGEWTPPTGKKVTVCPFCQKPIMNVIKSQQFFNNVADTLVYIKEQLGVETLLGEKAYSYFADFTRNQFRDDTDLIKQLCDKGVLDCLKVAIGKPESEHPIVMKRALSKLPKYLQDSPAVIEMLNNFTSTLGWSSQSQKTFLQLNQLQQASLNKSSQSVSKSGLKSLSVSNYKKKLDIISNIYDSEKADTLYKKIACDNIAPIEIRKEAIANIYDSELSDMLWEKLARDKSLNIETRKEAIENIYKSDIADELWEELSRDKSLDIETRKEAIENISESDIADKLWEELANELLI